MSDLPLNIPRVLERHFKGAVYSLHDRSYEGIEWLDTSIPKPALSQLESLNAQDIAESRAISAQADAATKHVRLPDIEIKKQVEAAAQGKIDAISKEESAKRLELHSALIDHHKDAEQSITEELAKRCWLEATDEIAKRSAEAKKVLLDTDWYVIRQQETGLGIPSEVLDRRRAARQSVHHGELVYANYSELRSKEYPSREEMIAALRLGGLEALKVSQKIKEINDKFKKPKLG